MAFIEWHQSYSVGVPMFDAQHKRLFSLLNELNEAMSQGKGNAAMGKVLNDLVNYTKSHFSAEEAAMREKKYAGLASHKAEHERLAQKVLKFQQEFSQGKIGLSVTLLNFLREWLLDHIGGTDKEYSACLNT